LKANDTQQKNLVTFSPTTLSTSQQALRLTFPLS